MRADDEQQVAPLAAEAAPPAPPSPVLMAPPSMSYDQITKSNSAKAREAVLSRESALRRLTDAFITVRIAKG